MPHSIISLSLSALLPVLVTFGLGFVAGKNGHFTHEQAGGLNKLVILYTLPLGLFAGMMLTPREVLMNMGPQALILALALALSFFLPLLFMRLVLRKQLAQSTLIAMVIGMPSVLFIGVPVLGPLIGTASTLLIVVSGLVQNLLILPVCLILMSMAAQEGGHGRSWNHHLLHVACQPVVWAPVLAIVLVIGRIHLPDFLIDSCQLLGRATGGIVLFGAGVVLQAHRVVLQPSTLWPVFGRNILMPGLCYGLLVAFEISPDIIRQTVLVMAIPTGSIALIVAMQFQKLEREVASSVALSTLLSIVTMGGFIVLTSLPSYR